LPAEAGTDFPSAQGTDLEQAVHSRPQRAPRKVSLQTLIKGAGAAGLGIAAALTLHLYLKGELSKWIEGSLPYRRLEGALKGAVEFDESISLQNQESLQGAPAAAVAVTESSGGDLSASRSSLSAAHTRIDPFHLPTEFGSQGSILVTLKRAEGYRVQSFEVSSPALGKETVRFVELEFIGRAGQLVDRLQLKKNVSIALAENARSSAASGAKANVVQMKLAPLGLPDGFYDVTVRLSDADQELVFQMYYGDDPNQTVEAIEEFNRQNSAEIQSQKRSLFYAARDLDQLARELARIYGQSRKNKSQWSTGTTEWLKSLDGVKQALKALKAKPTELQAFPDQVDSVIRYAKSLEVVFDEFSEAVKQSRDIASDRLSDLIAALSTEKLTVGGLSIALKEAEE